MAGIKLSQLASNEKTLTLNFEGTDLEITYKPGMFNKAFRAELDANKDNEGSLYEAIEKTVIKWNIVDDNEKMIPIKRDVMENFPTKMLFQVWIAILEDTADFLPKVKSAVSVAA
jgi:hypothetical protein